MTRKRLIKLLMGRGWSARDARHFAECARQQGQSYADAWQGYRSSLQYAVEEVKSVCFEIASVLGQALGSACVAVGNAIRCALKGERK